MSNYYTVYDNRTDKIIIAGNSVQCAAHLGIKQESFYYAISRQNRPGNHRYTIIVEKNERISQEKR